ncbi:MAG TPA: M1 family aminopeptidase, partial [Thermoanaerobaculia bacterium]
VVRFLAVEAISPRRPHAPIEPRSLEGTESEVAAIRFDQALPPGSEVTVEFALETTGRASQLVVDRGFALASWVEVWYPVPGDPGDGYGSPVAPGSTTIRMPAGWRAVAPGELVEVREHEDERIETWRTEVPAARSFAAGPLTRIEVADAGGVPVSFFVLAPDTGYAARAALLGRAIGALEQRFGPYPYPSWNVVEIPEELVTFAAASEQGFIMVRSSVLANESGALPLFAHEAGHAWWGNRMRGQGPGSRMIGEALAQYGAVVAIEALEGRDAAVEFLRFSREGYNPVQSALGYFYLVRRGEDEPLAVLTGPAAHNLADSKGMWFHHMLRERMGDGPFFAALRTLFERFDGRRATLDDLRAIVLAASDDRGMEAFLAQWLDRSGAPEIDLAWWSVDRGRGLEVTLEQRQEGEPYRVELDLAIDLLDGSTVLERVVLDERRRTFRYAVPYRAGGVRLDPHHRLLLWRPEYGPPPSRVEPAAPSPEHRPPAAG